MAGNLTDYLENALLEHSMGRTAFTKPTNTFAALFTVAPTDSTAGTEVSATNGYARQQITWAAASGGAISTSANVRFPAGVGTASGSWGTVVAVGIFDANVGGNLLWYGPLSANITITTGDSFTVNAGSLTASLD